MSTGAWENWWCCRAELVALTTKADRLPAEEGSYC